MGGMPDAHERLATAEAAEAESGRHVGRGEMEERGQQAQPSSLSLPSEPARRRAGDLGGLNGRQLDLFSGPPCTASSRRPCSGRSTSAACAPMARPSSMTSVAEASFRR